MFYQLRAHLKMMSYRLQNDVCLILDLTTHIRYLIPLKYSGIIAVTFADAIKYFIFYFADILDDA